MIKQLSNLIVFTLLFSLSAIASPPSSADKLQAKPMKASPIGTSLTCTKSSYDNNAATGSVSYTLTNQTGSSKSFTYGVGSLNDDGTITPVTSTTKTIANGSSVDISVNSWISHRSILPYPSGVTPAKYRIVPYSCINGQTPYYNAFQNGIYHELTLYVTRTAQVALRTVTVSATGSVTGTHTVGENETVKFTITNPSSNTGDYIGDVYLLMKKPNSTTVEQLTNAKETICLKPGQSIEVSRTVNITEDGTYTFYLSADLTEANKIAEVSQVMVAPVPLQITNGQFITGEGLSLSVDVKNIDKSAYAKSLVVKVFKNALGNSAFDFTATPYYQTTESFATNSLAANATRTITIAIPNFAEGQYMVQVYYDNYKNVATLYDNVFVSTGIVAIDFGSIKWRTYASKLRLDYGASTGMVAYYGYVGSTDSGIKDFVLLHKTTNGAESGVFENEGLILKGKANTRFSVAVTTKAVTAQESFNPLVAVTENITVTPNTVYVLSKNKNVTDEDADDAVLFYNFAGSSLTAGHSYLPKSAVKGNENAAPSFNFRMDAEETTSISISNITMKSIADAATFNMKGQQVDSNYHGIIIKNGKKYIK